MRLYKQVYLYFLSYAVNAVLSFGTVSLLTHYLSVYDYGIINLYSSFLIFLMPFVSGGILYPLSVEFFKRPPEKYKLFFSNALVIPIVSLFLFTLLCVIFQYQLADFLKVSPVWIWLMPLSAWAIMINEIVMLITRNKNKPVQFVFFSIGKNALEILITLILVIGLQWAWQGRLLSAFLAPAFLAILSVYLFSKWKLLSRQVDTENIKRIFLMSFPFIFERLAVFVMGYSDKYFINEFDKNSTAEVGLYGLAGQVSSIIYLITISFNSAYHPHLFKQLASGFKGKIHRTTLLYICAIGIAVVLMFIGMPVLFKYFIGDRFHGAQVYVYLLTSGYFMWGIYNAFLGYLLYLSKNRQIFFISITGMLVSILLNAFVVPRYGAIGAAVTSIFTYSAMALICFFYVRKYFLYRQ